MDVRFLKKGALGITNRALNLIYGFGYLVLVVRGISQREYGLFALTMSIVMIIDVLRLSWITTTSLKFLPATKNDKEYSEVFTAIVFLFSLLTIIISILFLVFSKYLAILFKSDDLSALFSLVPLYYLSNFPKALAEWVFISTQKLKKLVILNAVYTGLNLSILGAFTAMDMLSSARNVLLALSFGGLIASVFAIFFSFKKFRIMGKVKWIYIQRMFTFGKYALGDNICGMILEKLDVLMLGVFSTPMIIAVYNAGKRLADAYEIFLQGFWLIVYPSASKETMNIETLRNIYRKVIIYLFIILVPIIVGAIIFAYPIISTILGGIYAQSGVIFRFASVNVLFRIFLVFGGSILIGGLNKINLDFYTMLLLVAVNGVLNFIMIPKFGINGAATAMLLTTIVGAFIKNQLVCSNLKTNFFNLMIRRQHPTDQKI